MPDDKKAKDKSPATEPEQASKAEKGQEEQPAEAASTESGPAPLTYEQMERLRRKLKAKYH